MTIAILAAGWFGLAALVSRRGRGFLWGLGPAVQAGVSLSATLALAVIPVAVASASLAQALAGGMPGGSLVSRCGKLIGAVILQPLARPEVTLSLVLLVGWIAGIVLGAVSAWRSQSSVRALACGRRGHLVIVPIDEPVAFTAGLLRPRVVVSKGLLSDTPLEWRRAVLAHEEAHRRGRHPLMILLVESLARGIPLPPVRWAADAFRLSLEAVADESACRRVRSRTLVAQAIAGLALASTGAAAAFEGNEVRRVQRLLDPPRRLPPLAAGVVLAAVMGVFVVAGGHAIHCTETSVQALGVRQCRMA